MPNDYDVSLIVAMTLKQVIGNNGDLPWDIPEDLKNFQRITKGNTVLMGRKTFLSLDDKVRPLPDRKNIVITSHPKNYQAKYPSVDFCNSLNDGIMIAERYDRPVIICGGETIYNLALAHGYPQKLYVSWINGDYRGDIYFPRVDWQKWESVAEVVHDKFTFETYEKISHSDDS